MMRLLRGRALLLGLVVWSGAAAQVRAQEPLTDVLSFLLTNQAVPTGDFVKDQQAAQVTSDTVSRLLQVELATLPISASSAGFAYRLNPSLGTVERVSASFGPFFTERSLTAGRGQASLGVGFTAASFSHLDDRSLRDGRFISSGNQFRDEATPFDVEALTLRLESRTVTLFGNVGVSDRLDLSVAVPFVSVSLAGERLNTYRGTSLLQAAADARANGVGDVAVRAKYRLVGQRARGVSIVGETRLPTGRREDLLGAGRASYRGMLVGSGEIGRWGVHGNGGASVGGLSAEQHFRAAVTFSASPHVTLIGEVLGRRIENAGRVVLAKAPHPSITGVDVLRLVAAAAHTNSAVAVTGFKWNLARTIVLSGNVSLPLTSTGLRPRPAALVGLDVAFGG